MVKLATLAAIFSAFLLMSRVVEAHWTTITSVKIEEEGLREVGSCREQLQRQDLNLYERPFGDIACGGRGGSERERMESSENLRPCCEQLWQVPVRGDKTDRERATGRVQRLGDPRGGEIGSALAFDCGFVPSTVR